MAKDCIECGKKVQGRSDKIYCSIECRNAYHNRQNSNVNNRMRNINNILRRNYRLLSQLNPKQKTKVHKSKLLDRDFNFHFFTHIYTTKAGKQYRFIYDLGYLDLDNDYFVLVRQDDNKTF